MSTVLITGGTRGIGAACAKTFAKAGDCVYVVGRNMPENAAGDLCWMDEHDSEGSPGIGSAINVIACDLAESEGLQKLFDELPDVDILINNAGMLAGRPYDAYPEADRDRTIRLNMIAPAQLMSHYGSRMAERGSGRIVNIASHAAVGGHPDIWYGATKAALVNLTKSFAGLLGPHGVLVNAVSPGPVRTGMAAEQADQGRYQALADRTYLHRIAEPEEIAQTVFWLAKESPEYLNGENIVINNGAFSSEMGS